MRHVVLVPVRDESRSVYPLNQAVSRALCNLIEVLQSRAGIHICTELFELMPTDAEMHENSHNAQNNDGGNHREYLVLWVT